jgi:hypothetical protein
MLESAFANSDDFTTAYEHLMRFFALTDEVYQRRRYALAQLKIPRQYSGVQSVDGDKKRKCSQEHLHNCAGVLMSPRHVFHVKFALQSNRAYSHPGQLSVPESEDDM